MNSQRVVILGAGFGGLACAKALADAPVDVTVVDQRNHHTFQPLLYQVATAGLDADDVCYSTRGIFGRQDNARAIRARVTGIDVDRRLVEIDTGDPLPYDHLVVALGAVTNDFGVPGVAENAFGLKSAEDAIRLRTHLLHSFEDATRLDDPAERIAATSVVVVGGGPTGVEMAGGMAELYHRVLHRDFPELDVPSARIVLLEGQDRVLGSFSRKLQTRACRQLEHMGVEVRLNAVVSTVHSDRVELADGSEIPAHTVVWAAGVKPPALASKLGLAVGGAGRLEVDDQLRSAGQDSVYVIGDLAATVDDNGTLTPQVAPVAIQGGQHVAAAITAAVTGRAAPAAFRYRDKGSMATIGRHAAVVELPVGPPISGFLGWVAWLTLHLVMLIGFRNRANVLVNWAWNYLTFDRGSRVIVEADGPHG